MIRLGCLVALVCFFGFADDIVILDDVNGKEVHIAASALIKAYNRYTTAKAKEAKDNLPLKRFGLAQTYARYDLGLSVAESQDFAKSYSDYPDAKERLDAHKAWYVFARYDLDLREEQSIVMASEKSSLPNSRGLLAAYRKNYVHARYTLDKNETDSREFAEQMLKKVTAN